MYLLNALRKRLYSDESLNEKPKKKTVGFWKYAAVPLVLGVLAFGGCDEEEAYHDRQSVTHSQYYKRSGIFQEMDDGKITIEVSGPKKIKQQGVGVYTVVVSASDAFKYSCCIFGADDRALDFLPGIKMFRKHNIWDTGNKTRMHPFKGLSKKSPVDLDIVSRIGSALDLAFSRERVNAIRKNLPEWTRNPDYETSDILFTKWDTEIGFTAVKWEIPVKVYDDCKLKIYNISRPNFSKNPVTITYEFGIDVGQIIDNAGGIVDLDVIEIKNLTRTPFVNEEFASWSPDGNLIVYTTYRGMITIMDSEGNNKKFLARGLFPVWSPDGKRIAYLYPLKEIPFKGGDKGFYSIHIVDKKGNSRCIVKSAEEVYINQQVPPLSFGWLPDGRIVYEEYTDFGKGSVFVVDPDDGKKTLIRDAEQIKKYSKHFVIRYNSDCSFDKRFVIYSSFAIHEGPSELYMGSNDPGFWDRRITSTKDVAEEEPLWSPRAYEVVYVAQKVRPLGESMYRIVNSDICKVTFGKK